MNRFEKMLNAKKMTLIMSLPVNDSILSKAAFDAGADAVKVHINLHHNAGGEDLGSYEENRETFDKMLKEASGPMGIVPGAGCEEILKDIEKVKNSSFEFISFYSRFLPTSVLPISKTLMAACDSGYALEEIKAYEQIGAGVLEASVIPSTEYGRPLCLRDLAIYKSIVSQTTLPVVVPTQRFIRPEDTGLLAAVGVRGLMIGAIVTGKDLHGIVSTVKRFRKAIDEL